MIKKESFILLMEGDNRIFTNTTAQLNTIISMDNRKTIKWKDGKRIINKQKIDDHIRRHHNPLEFGHPGVNSTIAILRRSCYFKNIQAHVRTYVKRCKNCQQNKYSTHTKYSSQKTILLLERLWQEITIDFITKLPKSRDPATGIYYNSIQVIVDRFTKWAHIIPFKKSFNTKQLAHLYLDRVVRYYNYPKSIINNRDKLFRNIYQKTLQMKLGIKIKLLTVYHFIINKQTEQTNQTLKQYL